MRNLLLGVGIFVLGMHSPIAGQEIAQIPEPTVTIFPTLTPARPPDTPSPTPNISPLIVDWSEEIFYPQAIYFHIEIDLPLSLIRAMTLVLEVEGQPTRTITMEELVRSTIAQDYRTLVQLYWHVPADDLLPFLSEVYYHWDIVTAAGEFISVPGVVPYADPDFNWLQDNDPERRLSFIYPAGVIYLPVLRDTLSRVYDLLATNVGTTPHFRLALYSDSFPLDRCITNRDGFIVVRGESGRWLACEPPIMDTIIANTGYTPFEVPSVGGAGLQQALIRHMVKIFYAPTWEAWDAPEWFETGLTYLYFPGEKAYLLDVLRMAARNRELFTLDGMNTAPEQGSPRLLLWEAQSYGMVMYMTHQIGLAELFEFANHTDGEETFAESYAATVGQPLAALMPNLNDWIFSNAAAVDFQLELYEGPTSIPTVTSTITPFPSTPTPTATDTPTATPTATVTGFKSATPLPSRTPTHTLPPVTPTITPRPAGYRAPMTPTATTGPETSQGIFEGVTTEQILIAVIAAAATILLAAYLATRRR